MTTDTAASFSSLPLPSATINELQRLNYTAMTPIQAASLPLVLAGRDLIAEANTKSGKTVAFALAEWVTRKSAAPGACRRRHQDTYAV